jgi:LacI family transcriptional regulator
LPLIVVSYDALDLGRQAGRLLLDRVGAMGPEIPPRRVIIPTSVIEYGPPGGKYRLFGRADEGRAAAGS